MWGHTRLFTDSSVMWCVMVAPYTPLCSVCVCGGKGEGGRGSGQDFELRPAEDKSKTI